MKTALRTIRLFVAFWLLFAASYFAWVTNQKSSPFFNKDTPTIICITMAAIGFTILWMDWRKT